MTWQELRALEAGVWRSLHRWVTRAPRTVRPSDEQHPYIGATRVLLWAFIVVSAIEIPVAHLLIPWPWLQWPVLVVGVWGLLWMFGFLAAYTVHPHLVGDDGVRLRSGATFELLIGWDAVDTAGSRLRATERDSVHVEQQRDQSVLQLAASKQTNLHLTLRHPVEVALPRGPQRVAGVSLWVDDPRAMVRSIRARAAAEPAG